MIDSFLNSNIWIASVIFVGVLFILVFWQGRRLSKEHRQRGEEIDLFKYEQDEKKSQWLKIVDDISNSATSLPVLVQHLAGELDPDYYDEKLIAQIDRALEKHENIRMEIIFGPKLGAKAENKEFLRLKEEEKSYFLKTEHWDEIEKLNPFVRLFKKYKSRISLRLSENREARHHIAVSVSNECKFCILEEFHEPFKMSNALSIKEPGDKIWNIIKAEWEKGKRNSKKILVSEIPAKVPFDLPDREDCNVEFSRT